MSHTAAKCQSKDPANCPYHGTGTAAAVKNLNVNAFIDAKQTEEQIRRENFFLEQDLAPKFCNFSSNRTAYITIVGRATNNEDGSKEGIVRAATQIDRLTENRVDDTEFYFRKNGRDIQLFTDKNSTTPLNDSEVFDMFMASRKAYKR